VASFEELADRLADASEPAERARAAEQLARLDDARVAPALARALADPDPGVRATAERLLAQFCRRDATGNLQRLLDEAERVADALTTEVQRLRAGAPLEPPAPSVEPIEPPDGFDGPCALVRLAPRGDELKRAATLVAKALKTPRFLVTREVQTTKGFLARDVPAGVARLLVRELHAAGIVAAAVPMEQVPAPLPPARLREPVFEPAALRGTAVPGGEACEVAWSGVELALAARLEVELKRDGRDVDWSFFTPPTRAREGRVHELGYEYVLEVYAGEPARRYRLVTHELDFGVMQRRPSSFSRVARLARQLVKCVDRGRINTGLRRLEEQDEESWDDLTFVSPLGFEGYVVWHRLLVALGVPLPR
jgi:hypothetical protein